MQYEQHSYESGEISPDHVWRSDLKVRSTSLKSAKNTRILISGALSSRPGTKRLNTLAGDGLVFDMTVEDVSYMLILTEGRLQVYDQLARNGVSDVEDCPWTAAQLPDLVFAAYGSNAYVFHQTMVTQKITRSDAGTWTCDDFGFGDGIGGSKRQPYYRFADPGVTITPSGRTGSITLQASASVFVPGHVDVRFRLQGREVHVTAVTDGDTATATVIQELYPTVTLPVASSVGFSVGEIVTGKDTSAEAEVVAVPNGTSLTLLLQKFTDFYWDSGGSTGETVIGPAASTTTTGAQTSTTDAAVLDWDEQAINPFRGYPGTGTVHKNRLWMGRFPLIPFGVAASALGALDDFQVGDGDADAIFEELGDEGAGKVQHIQSAEQLLFMTSRRLLYYPESEQNPIRPTSFGVIQVGPDGASQCRPVQISEGVLFGKADGGSILGAFPTGDVRRSWRTADVTQLSAHLVSNPRSMAYVDGLLTGPERYVYAVNETGGMVVAYYSESAEVFGNVPWETAGAWRSIAAANGECWCVVRREIDGDDVFFLEIFEQGRLLDCACDVAEGAYQGPASGETILTPSGPIVADKVYRCAPLAGATCALTIGGAYVGQVTLDAEGDFGTPDVVGAIVVGFNFEAEGIPWPPLDAEDQRIRRRKSRIIRANVRWRGRYLAVDGKLQPSYRANEDMSVAPPLRDELAQVPCFGWSFEPTVTFSKPYPAPWQLLGHSLEVSR